MFYLKNLSELEKIDYVNKLNAELLSRLYTFIKPGIATIELEEIVIKFCEKHKVFPTFKNYEEFPGYICASLNDEIIHGIPDNRVLVENDLISIDCGLNKDGFHSDAAFTKLLGDNSKKFKLLVATESALIEGIKKAQPYGRINDISGAIQNVAIKYGFGVIKEFVGHGTGFALHEFPNVPNYIGKGVNWLLKPGMVLAIEPMFVEGSDDFYFEKNGWTVKTVDGGMAAHFEHTVAITDDGPKILSKL